MSSRHLSNSQLFRCRFILCYYNFPLSSAAVISGACSSVAESRTCLTSAAVIHLLAHLLLYILLLSYATVFSDSISSVAVSLSYLQLCFITFPLLYLLPRSSTTLTHLLPYIRWMFCCMLYPGVSYALPCAEYSVAVPYLFHPSPSV